MSKVKSVKNIWNRLVASDKNLKNVSKVHIDLIERLEKVTPTVSALDLSEKEIEKKLEQGVPFLEGEEDKVDVKFAILHFRELSNWSGLGESRSTFKKMNKNASDSQLEQFLRAWLSGDSRVIDEFAHTFQLPLDVLFVVARYSLLPTLHEYTKELVKTEVFNEEEWMKDYCPCCGDQHGIAEFRGSERFRHFRCLSCASDWIYWRIACPHCENKDHNKLSSLLIQEEKASYQIDVCEECNGYVKGVNKLDPSSPYFLLLDDFSTFHLDHLAEEKGYHKMSLQSTGTASSDIQ